MSADISLIRNFCIIAHIDHGKSTLADRMLELTGAIEARDMSAQVLDAMDLEKERGITIKAHPVSMRFKSRDGQVYQFNLIDTPGHVDFSYEVARSISACEGALLVVDATQGVEAQTVANTHLALDHNLEILPVLNKIDLPSSNVAEVSQQIEEILAIPMDDAFQVSAKTGAGVAELLEAIVHRVPAPKPGRVGWTRALVFDSTFDVFRGVMPYVRLMDGDLRAGQRIRMMSTDEEYEVKEVGQFAPKPFAVPSLGVGEVGYFVATIKHPKEVHIGDTVTRSDQLANEPLPGFRRVHPMVFCGLYPVNSSDFEKLKASLEKYNLNDSAIVFQAESSSALGFGFRCGFLGLLHMEIVQERLRREFDCDIIATYPGVVYRVHLTSGEVKEIDNPVFMPDVTQIAHIEEPMIRAHVICHNENIGDIMQLVMDKRGALEKTESIDTRRVMLTCHMPLNEIVVDFHDRLKSVSRGYASMDYELAEYQVADIVKMDILLSGEVVDAFSCLVHREKANARGRQMCKSLSEAIPRHQFVIPVQAAIGRNIIARETIRAFRKDVTAKCYGGDISRKRKLLERQKEGKKRMKQVGQVGIPQEAFIQVLKSDT
ncbi:MAG: elongation factor 4 [Lentisphaerae bacterium]|nr:elongation factor 4 [Lentisphaerota bacterium]